MRRCKNESLSDLNLIRLTSTSTANLYLVNLGGIRALRTQKHSSWTRDALRAVANFFYMTKYESRI